MINPESGEVYRPSEDYFANVDLSLFEVFRGTKLQKEKAGLFLRQRRWQDESSILSIVEFRKPKFKQLLGFIPIREGAQEPVYIFSTYRLTPDKLMHSRVYHYADSQLQVTNSYDELGVIQPGTLSYQVRMRQQVLSQRTEFAGGIHTPSTEEYFDFLSDLRTFSTAKEV